MEFVQNLGAFGRLCEKYKAGDSSCLDVYRVTSKRLSTLRLWSWLTKSIRTFFCTHQKKSWKNNNMCFQLFSYVFSYFAFVFIFHMFVMILFSTIFLGLIVFWIFFLGAHCPGQHFQGGSRVRVLQATGTNTLPQKSWTLASKLEACYK